MVKIMKNEDKAKYQLILSMLIFGTIGIFRRYIPLPSGYLSFCRGLIGALFLILVIVIRKKAVDFRAIKKNIVFLCLSGAFIGFNWIFLFESYNYTSVATATLCYYMAPVFVVIASPFLLKEKLTLKKAVCVFVAIVGMILVSGILSVEIDPSQIKGILFGLSAAVLYASVTILNKKIKKIDSYDKTTIQLLAASIVILPYALLCEKVTSDMLSVKTIVLVLIVGMFHTGMTYALYFGTMDNINAQTVALFSYIDPVTAIILSAVILKERLSVYEIIGAALILVAAAVSENVISFRKKKKTYV